jgi:hypothetical protein
LGRWSYVGGCSTADPSNVQSQVADDLFLLRRLLQLQLCNALGSSWFINIAIEEATQFVFVYGLLWRFTLSQLFGIVKKL